MCSHLPYPWEQDSIGGRGRRGVGGRSRRGFSGAKCLVEKRGSNH